MRGTHTTTTPRHRPLPPTAAPHAVCGVVLRLLVALVCCAACACTAETEQAPHPQARTVGDEAADPSAALATIFHELADILDQHTNDPGAAILATRTYLERNAEHIRKVVSSAEHGALTLSDGARAEYLERSEEGLRRAIHRFARAQQVFREHATEAQHVEFTEVLNSVR